MPELMGDQPGAMACVRSVSASREAYVRTRRKSVRAEHRRSPLSVLARMDANMREGLAKHCTYGGGKGVSGTPERAVNRTVRNFKRRIVRPASPPSAGLRHNRRCKSVCG